MTFPFAGRVESGRWGGEDLSNSLENSVSGFLTLGERETGKRNLCKSSKGILLYALQGAVSLVRTSLSWIIGFIVRELYRIVLRSAKMNDSRMSTLPALTSGHVVIKECLRVKVELSIGKQS